MPDEPDPRPPATLDEELLGAELRSIVSTQSDAARLHRIQSELAMGFRALDNVDAVLEGREPPDRVA